jgi:ectoine hydroxylase-related dioxygenase (phytanoyl-CoA dioxygenase family)
MTTPTLPTLAALTRPSIELSTEQIEFYHREGYLVVDQISTPEELEKLRAIYDDLFSRKVGREEGNQFDLAGADEEGKRAELPQILGPSKYAPEMKETLAWANTGRIMAQLFGREADHRGDHAILKPAQHGAPTPWHQDEAYWSPEHKHHSLSLWMPLQDVDEAMGCLQFIPKSHKLDILPHQPIGKNTKVHGLELVDGAYDVSNAVSCPLKAGGCTIHKQSTLHYAAPNRSNFPRRAWIMTGGLSAEKLAVPRRFPWKEIQQTARTERANAAVAKKN